LVILGENWETGNAGPLPICAGDPSPVMPDTLYRFAPFALLELVNGGRACGTGGGWSWSCSLTCKCKAGSDPGSTDGGVSEPVVGVVPWLASLEASVERSSVVLKLALDLLRKSLKFRKDGAMALVQLLKLEYNRN
jgi:hypothetical protein